MKRTVAMTLTDLFQLHQKYFIFDVSVQRLSACLLISFSLLDQEKSLQTWEFRFQKVLKHNSSSKLLLFPFSISFYFVTRGVTLYLFLFMFSDLLLLWILELFHQQHNCHNLQHICQRHIPLRIYFKKKNIIFMNKKKSFKIKSSFLFSQ